MTAEAQGAELRLRRDSKEYHHAKDVEFVMTQMLTALRQPMLAIPSRLAPYLLGKTQVAEIVRIEIQNALKELSGYRSDMFSPPAVEYLCSTVAELYAANRENGDGIKDSATPERTILGHPRACSFQRFSSSRNRSKKLNYGLPWWRASTLRPTRCASSARFRVLSMRGR